jgi:hypothetical protein
LNPKSELSQYPSFELGSQDNEYSLKIWSYGYEFPETKSGYDADWHRNHFYFKIGTFRAEFDEVCIQGSFLALKIKELTEFSATKRDSVEIEPLEPYFGLSFSFNGRKNVNVQGFIQHPAGIGPKLAFQFETDLSYVDNMISGMKSVLNGFPQR